MQRVLHPRVAMKTMYDDKTNKAAAPSVEESETVELKDKFDDFDIIHIVKKTTV